MFTCFVPFKEQNLCHITPKLTDETYIKIKGQWCYLYRAIDADGHILDIWLRKKRDHQSAYAFIKRLINNLVNLK